MEDRTQKMTAFLATTEWRNAHIEPLAGDASRRRYFRAHDDTRKRTAIVMDAPPEVGENVVPFLSVGAHLRKLGLSAPDTYAADVEDGFLLIEDLGDAIYDRVCDADPLAEPLLYDAAVDVLALIATSPAMEGLKNYTPDMTDFALPSLFWYVGGICDAIPSEAEVRMRHELDSLLGSLGQTDVMMLRDFHAQNLVWLPARHGQQRVGLLDYQDALTGAVSYDLVSLLKDARRDVSPQTRQRCMARFSAATGIELDALTREAAIISVQRNLRILMIFARMSLHFQKPHYVDLIPRVWSHLMDDLAHEGLAGLRAAVTEIYPAPDARALETLKAKCGTVPTL